MQSSAGPFCAIIPFAAVVVWLCIRIANADTRRERIGLISAACGVAGFITALLAPIFKSPEQTPFLVSMGVITLAFALAAVVLSIWAFRLRPMDQPRARAFPLVGVVCGALNLFCGAGILATGSGLLIPKGGEPWTWRSEEHGFELTLPSERWVSRPNPNVVANFACSRPVMLAMIAEVRPAATDAEFEAALARGREIRDSEPMTRPEVRSGPNRHAHPHWLFIGEANGPKGPYVMGVSVTRVGEKAVVLMFEGQYRMASEAGRAQEAQAFRETARDLLGSVK